MVSLATPAPLDVILAAHVTNLSNLVLGAAGYGQQVNFTQYGSTSVYANIFGNTDPTNGLAAKFQYGPAAGPTTIATIAKGGSTFQNNSSSTYGLTATNASTTTGKYFNVLAPNGTDSLLNVQRSSGGNDIVSINHENASVPNTSTFLVAKTVTVGGSTLVAHRTAGAVTSITISAGGYYTATPTITISGGSGSGATATCTIDANGAINSVTVTAGGSGYLSDPTVTANTGYVVSDVDLAITSTGGADVGAFRVTARQSSGDSGYRALEAHNLRQAGAGSNGTWAIETSVNSQVAPLGSFTNCGILLGGDNMATYGTANIQNNVGYLVYGANGWEYGFYYQDTDGTTCLFSVDEVGAVISAGIQPRANATYNLGVPSNRWSVIYADFHSMTSDGTESSPSLVFQNSTTSGWWRPGTNIIAMSTNQVERWRVDAAGNFVHGKAVLLTTATDGHLYIPTCAGTPTGTPTAYSGREPIIIDSTNHKLYFHDGAGWTAVN